MCSQLLTTLASMAGSSAAWRDISATEMPRSAASRRMMEPVLHTSASSSAASCFVSVDLPVSWSPPMVMIGTDVKAARRSSIAAGPTCVRNASVRRRKVEGDGAVRIAICAAVAK